MTEWYKRYFFAIFLLGGIFFLLFSSGGDMVLAAEPAEEFRDALRLQVADFFVQHAYNDDQIQDVKHTLEEATATVKGTLTRAVLDDLLSRMEETYPVSAVVETTAQEVELVDPIIRPAFRQDTDRYQLQDGHINISTLQTTWLQWVNELRAERGRGALIAHDALAKTAAERSETIKTKGTADHRRFADSGYYDYRMIEQRFSDRGVEFVNISRATFTENVGWGTFHCIEGDCTDQAIDALRGVFEFYRREEGGKSDAHRRTLIHPLFGVIWLGISVDETVGKLYMTTHYGTQVK